MATATLPPLRCAIDPVREQRMDALEIANRVRSDGAAVKREIRRGQLTVDDALDDDRAQALDVLALLTAQHGFGVVRARRILRRNLIAEGRRVGALTARQRELLRTETAP